MAADYTDGRRPAVLVGPGHAVRNGITKWHLLNEDEATAICGARVDPRGASVQWNNFSGAGGYFQFARRCMDCVEVVNRGLS